MSYVVCALRLGNAMSKGLCVDVSGLYATHLSKLSILVDLLIMDANSEGLENRPLMGSCPGLDWMLRESRQKIRKRAVQ